MELDESILAAFSDPEALENRYRQALQDGQAERFFQLIRERFEQEPGNMLLAAWYHRLKTVEPPRDRQIEWRFAIPIGIVTGLIFWLLTDFDWVYLDVIPPFFLWWAPIAAVGALLFVGLAARRGLKRTAGLAGLLLVSVVYVLLISPGQGQNWQRDYLTLMAIHLPLLAWVGLGIQLLGFKSDQDDRFAFLIRSIEVMITAGLYLIAGGVFTGITTGMFQALDINLPEIYQRLIVGGGFGLIPVLAVASIYNPLAAPKDQDFEQGLSKFIATMMRLMLPLTLIVLVIYIFVIPFNFMEPFRNRDVLIVYNLMLFAIMGLLIGATPIQPEKLSPNLQKWLRNGIILVAGLTVLVSLYALSATVFRTFQGRITINRLTIIGWNTINIGILMGLLYQQIKNGPKNWVQSIRAVVRYGTTAYAVWGVFLIFAIPLLFR